MNMEERNESPIEETEEEKSVVTESNTSHGRGVHEAPAEKKGGSVEPLRGCRETLY